MTFQTTALIKLHGSHGPVSREIPQKQRGAPIVSVEEDTDANVLKDFNFTVKNFFSSPFQSSGQSLKLVNVKHRGSSTTWWYQTSWKGLNRLTFHPNHVRVHPYFRHDFELRFILTGTTFFTSDVGGLQNGFRLRPLCQGVLWSLKLVEYLSISI